MSQSDTFEFDTDAIGRADPWQEREAGLPSDCSCSVCGGVIEHGDRCVEVRVGRNAYGDFEQNDEPPALICAGCVDV